MTEEIQTYQGEGSQAVGSPEHVNAMLSAIEAPIDTADEGIVSPQPDAPSLEGRPHWLPDKFESPEQMARAYQELENQFHNQESGIEDIEAGARQDFDREELMATPAHQVHDFLDQKGLDFQEFQNEYQETGQLSRDAYNALAEQGIDPVMVDTWIQGQEANADQQVDSIYNMVGGEQSYNQMLDWASDNLQPWEMDSFNQIVGNLDANSMFAVQGLMARMQNQEGSPPVLFQGEPSQYSSPKYESLAQLTAAMKDSRYATDPAYRNEVAMRLNNSSVL